MKTNSLILIVDDAPENNQFLSQILETQDYRVCCCESWSKAKEFLISQTPDLILLDVVMPDVSGIDACKALKLNTKTKDIPVIFLSALSTPSDKVSGLQAGSVDYVSKQPFQKEELLERVKTHILLKKSLDTIKQNEIELKKINASKDRFFSILSHDMKNPTAAIIGLSELLMMKSDKYNIPDVRETAENINTSIKTLYNLMENLLEWSMLQSNEMKHRPKNVIISDLIAESTEIYKNNFEKKNILFSTEVKDRIIAYCDPDMIKTIIRNLLSNAIKFTKPNGEISLKTNIINNYVHIAIKDSGIGIDESTIGKLFLIEEKFSTEGTMKEKGTGLGLILCKELIEKNEGEIWVTSEPEIGTTFTFSLPLSLVKSV